MIFPRIQTPQTSAPGNARANLVGFVPNVSGDSTTLNQAVPFTKTIGLSFVSDSIHVAGFRSFMIGLAVSAGTITLKILCLHPLDLSTVSEDTFADYTSADGHLSIAWGALAGNGGGGGGPINVGGLDGRIYTHMKLKLEAKGGSATVSALDGLWCAST